MTKTNGYAFRRIIDGTEYLIFVRNKKIELFKKFNITGIPNIIIETSENYYDNKIDEEKILNIIYEQT